MRENAIFRWRSYSTPNAQSPGLAYFSDTYFRGEPESRSISLFYSAETANKARRRSWHHLFVYEISASIICSIRCRPYIYTLNIEYLR